MPKLIELKTAAAAEQQQQQQIIFSLDVLTHSEEQWKEKAFVSKMVWCHGQIDIWIGVITYIVDSE